LKVGALDNDRIAAVGLTEATRFRRFAAFARCNPATVGPECSEASSRTKVSTEGRYDEMLIPGTSNIATIKALVVARISAVFFPAP